MAILGAICGDFSCSSVFSSWFLSFTTLTGSLWLSLLALIIFLFVIALYAGLPTEIALIFLILPITVGLFMTTNIAIALLLILAYIGFMVAKQFF